MKVCGLNSIGEDISGVMMVLLDF